MKSAGKLASKVRINHSIEIIFAQDVAMFLAHGLTKNEWALTIIFIKAIKSHNYKNANKNLSFKNL